MLNAQANRTFARLGYSDRQAQDAKREAWWWLQARWRMAVSRRRLLAGSAVVWTGPSQAQLVGIEVPVAGRGEVTIEVLASAVSPGTERAQFLRLPNTSISYPHVPGYSAAGVVFAVGADVADFKSGDLVAARGIQHASVATIPAVRVCRVPPEVTTAAAATLQLGTIAAQGVRRAAILPGESVCVIGAGLIGLIAQRLAAAAGAEPVTVVATSRGKESLALSGGPTRFLTSVEDRGEIEALGASVVIEATGDPDAIELAVAAASPGARLVLLGSSRGLTRAVPVEEIRTKGLRLIGAHVETLAAEALNTGRDSYRREAEGYLRALAERRITLDDLLDTVVDPREAAAFYRDLVERHDLAGAVFDWAQLPASDRVKAARMSRLPDIRARGMAFGEDPVRTGGSRWKRIQSDRYPFDGATGNLRIGLLGCGEIGITNAAALEAAPNTELVACFDPARALAEDLGSAHGATVCEDVDTLLEARDVDAVLVAVPHHLHAELAVRAAEAGKHVIVEKPAANDLEGAVKIATAAELAGVVLSVCFPHRYQPHIAEARRLINSGALGEFTGMLIKILSKKPDAYWYGGFSGRTASDWRASKSKAGGGFLIMNVCHYFDQVRYLVGLEIELVTAYIDRPAPGREVENAVSVAACYENSGLGTIVGSAGLAGFESARNEIHLWGRDGNIALEPELRVHTLRAVDGLRPNRWHTLNTLPSRSEIGIRAIYFSRLASAIARGEAPDVTAADGLAAQAFLEAAYRSSESGHGVRPGALLAELVERAPE
jgi:2-desacetyl-2-hydroxyethyl bacteriochlorophyllide A dehydrogenase